MSCLFFFLLGSWAHLISGSSEACKMNHKVQSVKMFLGSRQSNQTPRITTPFSQSLISTWLEGFDQLDPHSPLLFRTQNQLHISGRRSPGLSHQLGFISQIFGKGSCQSPLSPRLGKYGLFEVRQWPAGANRKAKFRYHFTWVSKLHEQQCHNEVALIVSNV